MADHNGSMVKDPKLVLNRIFIGNIPQCTRDDLESICAAYGKVLDSLVQKNYGFVQFESEEIATKAAKALNKSLFKGNQISVRNAGHKKRPNLNPNNSGPSAPVGANPSFPPQPQGFNNTSRNNPDYNDCEIIVVDRQNTAYAEFIETRLKNLNLQVDVLFPNEEVSLGKVLANISSRGCMYAILVTPQNEEHRSITVNILYGVPAEHRNMPVDDAINLIVEDFRTRMGLQQPSLPKVVQVIPPSNVIAPPLKERHPDAIQILLNLLADNMPLTVLQYDCIIKYLNERRELQLKVELGDAATNAGIQPDPEIELQKKILNILNKPSVAETHYELLYPNLEKVKEDYRAIDLLKDVRVQNAIDSMLTSSLMSTIEKYMKF